MIENSHIIENKDNIECFICYENKNENEIPIKLKEQKIYIKICMCDVWIHNKCLSQWCKINNKCPICRINIINISKIKMDNSYTEIDESIVEISNFNLCVFLFCHIMNIYKNLIKFIFIFLIIFYSIQLYSDINKTKIIHDNNKCYINDNKFFYNKSNNIINKKYII